MRQLVVYLESIFLPPYGILVGLRYLRQKENKSKVIGVLAIVLTIISIVVFTKVTLDFINTVNSQVNEQLKGFGEY